ncbi:unnamed protein product [Clonostachys rosea f. rosea IK726]|uniref:DUF7492 domain-containing protein n=2 Tax=Bionectria ochroleuca TaxID=29856 RepID=A0A0B7K5I7_BIOOC|nr:unnamed protein product [Clonostachys rosea f. rosea IK726]
MRNFFSMARAGLIATSLLALTNSVDAHSWIERAIKINAANQTFFGAEGYPRGYIPRSDPSFNDEKVLLRLPYTGTAFYTGDEKINKAAFDANPSFPMLEAAPGDFIAITHLENGHTTKPQTNPLKPYNRGTVFLYGTADPKDDEKLFDIHLKWNTEGTGGDGRGKLLSTRNYDDGQCYEARNEGMALSRAQALKTNPSTPLACQSDLQLPDDLKPGSIYTIYWYWDWPNLNPEVVDMEATKNGIYPWAGTFMRGEKDPNGFTMQAIATNESYASTLDIKIVEKSGYSTKANTESSSSGLSDVFNMAIASQLKTNFDVNVNLGDGGDNSSVQPSASSTSPTPTHTSAKQSSTSAPGNGATATVTVTETIPATTVVSTVYVTTSGGGSGGDCCHSRSTIYQTVTDIDTQYTTVYPKGTPTSSSTASSRPATPTGAGMNARLCPSWRFVVLTLVAAIAFTWLTVSQYMTKRH